jgi:hypothetical protein
LHQIRAKFPQKNTAGREKVGFGDAGGELMIFCFFARESVGELMCKKGVLT